MKKESGKITLGFVIFIALFAIAVDTAFKIVPIYMNYLNFKSEIESRAMEPQQINTDNQERLKKALMNKAIEFNIPLDEERLLIDLGDHTTHIKASWSAEAKFLAGYYPKKFPFSVEITKLNLRP